MSGKALFTFDPTLFQDDDGAADDDNYEEEKELPVIKEEKKENNEDEPDVDEALFAQGADDEEDIDFD
jgi:hypothetical protein